MFERVTDEAGYPVWARPAPSLRLLARDSGDYQPVLIRYAPEVAGRLAVTPARHYDDAPAMTSGKVTGASPHVSA